MRQQAMPLTLPSTNRLCRFFWKALSLGSQLPEAKDDVQWSKESAPALAMLQLAEKPVTKEHTTDAKATHIPWIRDTCWKPQGR